MTKPTDRYEPRSLAAYLKGWADSRAYGAGTRKWDLERSEDSYQARHGAALSSVYAAGWEDYAADNPQFASLKPSNNR